jgi:putative spermidine/putrescine transport system ATP-binding protein
MSAAVLLRMRAVRKTYGSSVAVDSVSLDVHKGEFLTFLGPSGSGKTTVLMAIAGFIELTSGSLELDGKPLEPLAPHERDIGMVFQNYALFPHMTVARNVGFALSVRRVPKKLIETRVASALDLVGLPGYGDRLPSQLSGGQQQRVALARAMVFEPRMLLMDEPLGALDRKLRSQMQREITRLQRALGITILFVTHDQEEALTMSDRIAVFNGGRIVQVGTPQELYERPSSRFVADFVGESNFFLGTVRSSASGKSVIELSSGIPLKTSCGIQCVVGTAVTMAVRPERICLFDGPVHAETVNRLTGSVCDVAYLGQSRRTVIALDIGGELVSVEQLSSQSPNALTEGTRVIAAWRMDDGILVDD